MKITSSLLLLALLWVASPSTYAQSAGGLHPEDTCFIAGQPGTLNIWANDFPDGIIPPGLEYNTRDSTPCFTVTPNGFIAYKPGPDCPCRAEPYVVFYAVYEKGVDPANSQPVLGPTTATITIKCPKPDCALVNLEDFLPGQAGGQPPTQAPCVNACEDAKGTYYLPYDSTKTYTWTVSGGTLLPGNNPAQIMVAWGTAGTGSITLVLSAGNTVLRTITFCVNVLDGPTASWTASDKTPCKDATVTFNGSASIGANSYFWDFGDGGTSAMQSPSHTYTNPGTYTACLIVTKDNYDVEGNPLCCCADTMCMDIVVDSLPGPSIYCVSTLCAGDESDYWTDAANCAVYDWTVLDENGNPWPFTGDGTPMIHVVWGNGPVGTVLLEVSGCDDAYCDDPSSVTIPIISPTVQLGGPTVVCPNETVTYTVPKWMSADYVWSVNPVGAAIISPPSGSNTVSVQWFASGALTVNYSSPFLSGLPPHGPTDCSGTGSVSVTVKSRFQFFAPSPVCLGSSSTITASPTDNYTWTITPNEPFTGNGNSTINVTWNTPGPHTVTAVPFNPATYCNAKDNTVVQVIEVPKPDSIAGPKEICVGQPYTYVGYNLLPGTSMVWTVNDGGSITTANGNSVTVTWSSPGPYFISLALQRNGTPMCVSDTIRCEVTAKKLQPLSTIFGTAACLNAVNNYSVLNNQHPDAVYTWTVSPSNIGSIVGGQGTYSITVQWNNAASTTTATVSVKVTLCNDMDTETRTYTLQPLTPTTITSSLVGCAYVLTASGGLPPYTWSTNQTGASITVTTPGVYTVTNSNTSGCTTTGSITVAALPLPTAQISSGTGLVLCILPPSPASTTLTNVFNSNYSYAWYCNGIYQPGQTGSTFTHNNTNVAGNFPYYVIVTDNTNGCTKQSNTLTVVQDTCEGPCTPIAHTPPTISYSQTIPNCSVVNFTANNPDPNVTLLGWNFGDITGSQTGGGLTNPTFQYGTVGCYQVVLTGSVPSATSTGTCLVTVAVNNVCIPIIADFTAALLPCTKTVNFNSSSTTYILADGPAVAWSWNFGGTGTSAVANPSHTFPAAGTYSVSLTVTNAAGCQSTKVLPVTIPPMVMPVISFSPNPVCAGEPVQFNGSGAGITMWEWNFGIIPPNLTPTTNLSQNPSQSFPAGTYTVVLTGKDGAGCTATATAPLTVNPAADPGMISASDTDLCAGETATLMATTGTMWMWSTGATTQSITVNTSGTYSVVIKDANGCTASPASVTVTVRPAPPAAIAGNPVICDAGCTTLNAPQSNPVYMYDWQTGTGGPLTPPNTTSSLQVCSSGFPYPPGTYQVVVKDVNGCTAVSADVTVSVATSPSFSVSAVPTPACAGTPTTLSIVSPQPNVVYSWSNGGSGISTVVTQAGTYQAVGVDTLTGCSFAASATVNALPDFCIVPAGCYKVCDPDTICGPDGLAAYQWNLNGVPIAGATSQCLIVTQMGTYSLTGTTTSGCSSTSDSLQLMVMPCDPVCDSISVLVDNAVTPNGEEKPCCFNIVVNNAKPNFFTGVTITALSGGTLPIGNVAAGTGWTVAGFSSPTSVTLEPGGDNPIPIGGSTCAQICMVPTASTQQILVEFLDANGETLCDTILELECEHCVEIYEEDIVCDTVNAGQYQMTFCVHNANTNTFNANAIVLMGPPGATFNPAVFSLPNIPPNGSYCSLTTTITLPPGMSLQNFCIGYTIHEQDVSQGLPPKECCMIKECYDLPDCCPNFATAMPVDTTDGNCCWKITLNQPPGTATSVTLNVIPAISPVSISGILPPISPWTFSLNPPQSVTWSLTSGNPLPAVITLPTVCFDVPAGSPVPQELEVVWSSSANDPLCYDTLEFFCHPDTDCVALTPLSLVCSGGQNVYTVVVTNPFGSTLTTTPTHVALVDVTPPGALVGSPIFPVGSLTPGNSAVLSLTLQGTAGTQVCFRLNAYSNPAPNIFIDCCVTDTFCVTLKACSLRPYLGELKLYPNPVRTNDVTLDFGDGRSPDLGRVRIRDVAGRLLLEEEVPAGFMRHDVSLPNLASGLYFVEFVEDGSRVWSQKLSVMRL